MFNVLAHVFPYEKVLANYGLDSHQCLPRHYYAVQELSKRPQCLHISQGLADSLKTAPTDHWDAFDRYCKTSEAQARITGEQKEH